MVVTDTIKEFQTTELSQLMHGHTLLSTPPVVLLLTGTKDCSLFSGPQLRAPPCFTTKHQGKGVQTLSTKPARTSM